MILSLMKLIAIRGCFLPAQGRRQLRSPSRATPVKRFPCKWDANWKLVHLPSWHYQQALGATVWKWHANEKIRDHFWEKLVPSSHCISGSQVRRAPTGCPGSSASVGAAEALLRWQLVCHIDRFTFSKCYTYYIILHYQRYVRWILFVHSHYHVLFQREKLTNYQDRARYLCHANSYWQRGSHLLVLMKEAHITLPLPISYLLVFWNGCFRKYFMYASTKLWSEVFTNWKRNPDLKEYLFLLSLFRVCCILAQSLLM